MREMDLSTGVCCHLLLIPMRAKAQFALLKLVLKQKSFKVDAEAMDSYQATFDDDGHYKRTVSSAHADVVASG